MRILTITNQYPNPFQPHRATFNREQVRALSREHEISVISPIAWTDELTARRSGSPALPPGRRMEWDSVPVEYPRSLFVPRILRGWHGKFYYWSVRAAFRRAVATFHPDIIFATWAYPDGYAAVELGHQAGLPVVLKVHGSDILQLHHYPGRLHGTLQAIQRADRVVVVSRDLAKKVIELGADSERVHLIYNGVDSKAFCPGDRTEARLRLGLDPVRPVFLSVGNLLPVKGPDILINACGVLAKSGVDFELHVIGNGPLRPRLERQADDLGIADRVRFQGAIPHQQLPDWFRAADVFVLPSRSEGVPNVLLEATACGTPYVASNVGGVSEIAHFGSGRLVSADQPGSLTEAIKETLLVSRVGGSIAKRPSRGHTDAANELTAVFETAFDDNRVDPGRRLCQSRVAVPEA